MATNADQRRSAISNIDDILRKFGTDQSALLGEGAEAQVFSLRNGLALRVNRSGANEADVLARANLLARIGVSSTFQIPRVRDYGYEYGLHFTVEDHLTGMPMSDALPKCSKLARENLVQDYLNTSKHLAGLLTDEAVYGEIGLVNAIQTRNFRDFLYRRAEVSLSVCNLDIVVENIVSEIEEPTSPALVHLDYCPSNVLCEGSRITAVLDFGGTTIAGCASFNPIVAVAFLDPSITPAARTIDQEQAYKWLADCGLCETSGPVTKWLAAYWSFCGENEDLALFRWCQRKIG